MEDIRTKIEAVRANISRARWTWTNFDSRRNKKFKCWARDRDFCLPGEPEKTTLNITGLKNEKIPTLGSIRGEEEGKWLWDWG